MTPILKPNYIAHVDHTLKYLLDQVYNLEIYIGASPGGNVTTVFGRSGTSEVVTTNLVTANGYNF